MLVLIIFNIIFLITITAGALYVYFNYIKNGSCKRIDSLITELNQVNQYSYDFDKTQENNIKNLEQNIQFLYDNLQNLDQRVRYIQQRALTPDDITVEFLLKTIEKNKAYNTS